MPKEVAEYLRKLGQAYGKLGGKTAAKNMTDEERSARAKKAFDGGSGEKDGETAGGGAGTG